MSAAAASSLTSERILTILKQIITWYEKWKAAHNRGIALCQSVEAIKKRAFDQRQKDKDVSLYPDDLKSVCDNLAIVMATFVDAVNAVALFEKQMTALSQLWGAQLTTTAVVFKTWKMSDIQDCVGLIHKMFRHECEIKRKVIENIAHANSKDEVVWHSAIWMYPAYANAELDLKITSLSVEIS